MQVALRITPAYAGKSHASAAHHQVHRDHPRLHGEKVGRIRTCAPIPGSPPPTRGKGSRCTRRIQSHRITPAYAGKSTTIPDSHLRNWDHPRLRGEKYTSFSYFFATVGSPPPTRGKETGEVSEGVRIGITPAYAGKSTPDHSILLPS